jgi:hypothetical protein
LHTGDEPQRLVEEERLSTMTRFSRRQQLALGGDARRCGERRLMIEATIKKATENGKDG